MAKKCDRNFNLAMVLVTIWLMCLVSSYIQVLKSGAKIGQENKR